MASDAKLRLKLPNGSEFEAAGDPDFVRSERAAFLDIRHTPQDITALIGATGPQKEDPRPIADWSKIAESNGNTLQLRAKLRHDKTRKDACLVLLAASQKLLNQPRPTAAQLARWLRASGYPIGRIDRVLSEALSRGEILASGSRRARRYQLTGPGFIKACLLAEQLATAVSA